jgi:hypothetical protein
VGVGNTVLSFIVYRLLLALGAWYVIAAPLAFAAGALKRLHLQQAVDVRGTRLDASPRALRVCAGHRRGVDEPARVPVRARSRCGAVVAYLVAIPPVTLCMFAANRLWTFAERP